MAEPVAENSRDRPPEGRDSHGERHPNGWRVSPGPDGRGAPPSSEPPKQRILGPAVWILLFAVLLFCNVILISTLQTPVTRVRIPYSPTFLTQVEDGNVSSIASKGTSLQGVFRTPVRYPDSASPQASVFSTEIPEFANNNTLLALLQSKGVVINARAPSTGTSVFVTILLSFGPALLIVLLFIWMMRRASGLGGAMSSFGRSRAQRVEPSQQQVTFEDVAGIDEAKDELTEIVDFLRDPDKYRRLGGRIPREYC